MKGISNQITLKSLEGRIEKEKAEIRVTQQQITELKNKLKQHNQRLSSLQLQLNGLTKEDLILSEHAKLRYLERVELINLSEIENKIITEELKKLYKILGNGEFPIGIGEHTCIIRNGVITTIK